MKSLFNDEDGLSLYDLCAISILGFLLLFTMFIFGASIGKIKVDNLLKLYELYIPIPTTVVGGMFLKGSAQELWNNKLMKKTSRDVLGTQEPDYSDFSEESFRV